MYLCSYGIADIKTDALMAAHGSDALRKVKADPYKLLGPLHVPFKVMDEIAFTEGLPHTDRGRVKGIIFHAMDLLTRDGSTRTDIKKLYRRINDISEKSVYHSKIPRGLVTVTIKDIRWLHIAEREGQVYFKEIWKRECGIAAGIKRLEGHKRKLRFKSDMAERMEKEIGITYAGKQKEAFGILKETGIKVLTGGPGDCGIIVTGRTNPVKSRVCEA